VLGATDDASGSLITFRLATLVRQRVFGIALGYEDVNDDGQPRLDPIAGAQA
jgi:hypothetical protein